MRPIDADSLLTTFIGFTDGWLNPGTARSYEELLISAPTLPWGVWHNVNDELPPANEKVLVYAVGRKEEGFEGKKVFAITSMHDTISTWPNGYIKPHWNSPWQYFLTDYKITHWMYLPPSPKENE